MTDKESSEFDDEESADELIDQDPHAELESDQDSETQDSEHQESEHQESEYEPDEVAATSPSDSMPLQQGDDAEEKNDSDAVELRVDSPSTTLQTHHDLSRVTIEPSLQNKLSDGPWGSGEPTARDLNCSMPWLVEAVYSDSVSIR